MARPQDWAWSSLRAHLEGRDDPLVRVAPLLERLGRITALIDTEPEAGNFDALRAAESHGRPLGSDSFIAGLEHRLRRSLRRRKPGPKPRTQREEMGD